MYRIVMYSAMCLIALVNPVRADVPELEYVYPISTAWTEEKNAFDIPKTPYIPYMNALFLRADMKLKTKAMPPKRLFKDFKDGKSQFGLLVRAPALKDCCLFSKNPITSMPINVYYQEGMPAITNEDDLVGKKIGLIHGYSYGRLRKFLETHEIKSSIRNASDHEELFKVLMTRNHDEYVIDYEPISEEMIQKVNADSGHKTISLDARKRFDINLYFVISKAVPNAAQILEKLEAAAMDVDVRKFERDFKNRKK